MENSERFGGSALRHGLSQLPCEGRQIGGHRARRDETVDNRAAGRLAEGLGGQRPEDRETFGGGGDGPRGGMASSRAKGAPPRAATAGNSRS